MNRPISTFAHYDRPLAETRPRVVVPLLAILVLLCGLLAWLRWIPH